MKKSFFKAESPNWRNGTPEDSESWDATDSKARAVSAHCLRRRPGRVRALRLRNSEMITFVYFESLPRFSERSFAFLPKICARRTKHSSATKLETGERNRWKNCPDEWKICPEKKRNLSKKQQLRADEAPKLWTIMRAMTNIAMGWLILSFAREKQCACKRTNVAASQKQFRSKLV